MGQIKTHHISEKHNPTIGEEHVIASSIHKHTDILAYVFVPLAATRASILETSCWSYKTTQQKENTIFISTKPENSFIVGLS